MDKLRPAIIVILLLITATIASADRTITSVPQDGPYTTNGTLTATSEISDQRTVFFGATDQIILKPGFHARSGSVFRAKIGNYTNLTGSTDNDTDHQADWWELTHFGTTAYTPDTDRDGDGVPDFMEVIYGTNPTDAGDVPQGVIRYEYDELGRIKKIYRF